MIEQRFYVIVQFDLSFRTLSLDSGFVGGQTSLQARVMFFLFY